jgi:hypothetical protein
MTIFDLLLILVVLISLVLILTILYHTVSGHFRQAWIWTRALGGLAGAYLLVLVLTSVASPQAVIPAGQDQCFDDWCLGVRDVQFVREIGQTAPANGVFCQVAIRISNRARGREQRENGTVVFVLDGQGRRYSPSPAGQQAFEREHGAAAPLSSVIPLGQFIDTVRVFDIPADVRQLGLVVSHETPTPALFVIGDGSSLLHKPTILQLPVPPAI